MWKKRIVYSLILLIIGMTLVAIIFFQNTTVKGIDEPRISHKVDVIMSTKVSRPGCETTNSCYTPSIITIKRGSLVTWMNEDSAFHSVTSGFYDDPNELFDSGYLDPQESFTFSFEDVGTYNYFCTLHPWMKGQVIVQFD